MTKIPYANIVGCIMFAMVCTRPDLAYPVSMVSRFMGNPGRAHSQALKWVMRFIAGSLSMGLQFGRGIPNAPIAGYIDADYAGCLDSRKSISGHIFKVFAGVVSWRASLQHVVALSTTEVE